MAHQQGEGDAAASEGSAERRKLSGAVSRQRSGWQSPRAHEYTLAGGHRNTPFLADTLKGFQPDLVYEAPGAHHSLDEVIIILVGEAGQPFHLVQHHLLQKFRPNVRELGAFARTGIVVLVAEKLNGVIALAKVEIEIATALRTSQVAGKYAGLSTMSLS